MAFDFNFSNTEVIAESTNASFLPPYEVHTVKLISCTFIEDNYKRLETVFGNDNGEAKLVMFVPNEADSERRKGNGSNGAYEMASRAENLKIALGQMIKVLNPAGFEKLMTKKINSWENFFKATALLLTEAVGAETQIKLDGYINKNGYTAYSVPTVASVNMNAKNDKGEHPIRTSDNFIGDRVALTNYELKRKKDYLEQLAKRNSETASAVPTKMDDSGISDLNSNTTDNQSDDDLLAGF